VARLSSSTVRYVHELRTVPAPKPEQLRVLYLTANPEQNLWTDAEVRGVQDQVRRALHRTSSRSTTVRQPPQTT
jgi:hypothetical protein